MNDTLDDFSSEGVHVILCLLASNPANYQRNTTRWRVIDVKRSFPPLRQKREGALNKRARNSKSLRNDGLQTFCPGYDEHRLLQRIDHGHHWVSREWKIGPQCPDEFLLCPSSPNQWTERKKGAESEKKTSTHWKLRKRQKCGCQKMQLKILGMANINIE